VKTIHLPLLLFIITSFEMGTFNVFFGSVVHNTVIASCILIILFYWAGLTSKFGKIINVGYFDTKEFRYFSLFLLFSALYFIIHAFAIGPLTSIKYSVYLFILFLLLTQTRRKDFDRLCVMYFYLMAFISIAAVVQIILVSISGVSIYEFDSIKLIEDKWFRNADYVMPYLLTYASVEENVSFGPLSFVRAIGLSSEPKYFSVMLWVAYAISLGWNSFKSKKKLLFIRISLLLGLFFSHAYTSLLIVAFSFAFYWLLNLRLISNKIKTIIIFFTPILLSLLIVIVVDILFFIISPDSYEAARVRSFVYSIGSLNVADIVNFGLLGSNVVREGGDNIGVTTLEIWFRLGHIGFILYCIPIMFVIYKSIINFRCLKQNQKYSQVILLATYIVFYQIFFSQPYTLLSIFILASIYVRTQSVVGAVPPRRAL
jgi:hypothetical protein